MAVQGNVVIQFACFRPRAWTLVLLTVAFVAFACSSAGTEVTPDATPTDTPVPTAISHTPTATAVIVRDINLPLCNTGGQTTSGSLGTAPAPTPTPVPDGGVRYAALISSEVSEYLSKASPIVDHLRAWNDSFNSKWSIDLEPDRQAHQLQILGIRLTQACSAVAQIAEMPPEVVGFDALLREATRIRHSWVRIAAEQLDCCGNAFTIDIDRGNTETSAVVSSLTAGTATLVQQFDARPERFGVFKDQAIGIELSIEPGWLVAADGLNPVLYAPFVLNESDIAGLGPDRWMHGTAVRIRRLRNPEAIDAATASSRFTALITQQGNVSSVEQISVDGVPALRHVLSPENANWAATVTVFISNDFTYFVETGCSTDVEGACDSAEMVAASLRLL